MIQRIQTLYLLGVLVLLALCAHFPVTVLTDAQGKVAALSLIGIVHSSGNLFLHLLLLIILGISVILDIICIFLYKKRKIQMKQCMINIFLLVGLNLLLFVQLLMLKMSGIAVLYRLPIIFPLLCAVFTYLAYRGIKKDDELVKSYDRLR